MLFGHSSLSANDEASSYPRSRSPITCEKHEYEIVKGHQVREQRQQRWSSFSGVGPSALVSEESSISQSGRMFP